VATKSRQWGRRSCLYRRTVGALRGSTVIHVEGERCSIPSVF
jgi:hypothetical protein